jgi:dTDP-4-dehydrorhamnose 3,5-epimerase
MEEWRRYVTGHDESDQVIRNIGLSLELKLKFSESKLSGNFLIDLELKEDDRGFFARSFCVEEFADRGMNTNWMQSNISMTREPGTLRGLHFQTAPYSEVKLVRCTHGAIWDVVVDLRADSPSRGKWFGATLSRQNRTMMYVPEGFAHGFVSLESGCEVFYLVSNLYSSDHEGILMWNDPYVGIDWPLNPTIISRKDRNGSFFNEISLF